jgi:AbrB family looped-hinge helix DNA binding protein
MLAKITSKNQLTLPKSITDAIGSAQYFDVETNDGRIVLTPVRIQRSNAVRAKLAALNLSESDVTDAVAWARKTTATSVIDTKPRKTKTN